MPQADSPRGERLRHWAAEHHGLAPEALSLTLAAGDASFRRYFRLVLPDGTRRILMDAPPAQEDSHAFVAVADAWARAGLPVPRLHAVDLAAGFIELDDLGDTPLERCFGDECRTLAWFDRAFALLHRLQNRAPVEGLPSYDAALLGRELDLFPDWCLERLLGLAPPPGWEALRAALIDDALAQPRVAVHRDFDAMNLMVQDDALYLIDFQDAVAGPLTYDLISLTHGRYRRFEAARLDAWAEAFRRRAIDNGRLEAGVDGATFRRWVDAMAAQRALKVLGIFCRLTLRDHKAGYLARLPHFLAHLRDALDGRPAFAEVRAWLDTTFAPALAAELERRAVATEAPR